MNELIQNLVTKVGITEEQAKGSVETVAEFVKGKLPASFHGQIDKILAGGEAESFNPLDAAKDALGGFFGKNK